MRRLIAWLRSPAHPSATHRLPTADQPTPLGYSIAPDGNTIRWQCLSCESGNGAAPGAWSAHQAATTHRYVSHTGEPA